jgi:MFS family permease
MRTAHATHHPHHPKSRDQIPDAPPRRRRRGSTFGGILGGMIGAFIGLFVGYVAGITVSYFAQPPAAVGILPPPTLSEVLAQPGDRAMVTFLSIPLGFIICGWLGEKVGRRFLHVS